MEPAAHDLSPSELEQIFNERIMPDVLATAVSPVAEPELVILAGQPGSGKSVLRPSLERHFARTGGAVGVSGDEFRPLHPHFETLLTGSDDLLMAQATRQAAAWLTDKVITWSISERFNIVWEDTLWNAERTLTTMQAAKGSNYRTTLVVLAVPIVESRLGILARYLGQRERVGAGRWTSGDAHDTAPFDRLAESLAQIERTDTVDRVIVTTRDHVVFDRRRPIDGQWASGSPAEHLVAARNQALPPVERAALQRRLEHLTQQAARLAVDHNLPIERLITAIHDDLTEHSNKARTQPIRPSDALER